jgi:branched-chain amino acid transport system permease protein
MIARLSLIWGTAFLFVSYPFFFSDFWVLQIGGRTLGFGTIALSLVFLSAYVGALSLAQMTLAGIAGYAVAYLTAPATGIGVLLPWPIAVMVALGLAVLAGLLVGVVAVRTEGVYTLMITLAIAVGFYFLTLQNYALFNGFTGFTRVPAPVVFAFDMARPRPFYYLSLGAAAACYFLVRWVIRTPLGLALQAARDNGRRLRALGYQIGLMRVAAFGFAGFLAGVGGILNVWLNGSISPGSVAITPALDVLMAAVLGGMLSSEGAYLGAFLFTVVQTFAIYWVPAERFNTLIGVIFVSIVLLSPDGLLGLLRKAINLFISWRTMPGTRDSLTRSNRASSRLSPIGTTLKTGANSTGDNDHAQ